MSPAGVTFPGLEQEDGLWFSTIFLYVAIHHHLIIYGAFVSLRDTSEIRPRSTSVCHTFIPSHLLQHQIKSHGQVQRQCRKDHTGVSHILPHLLPLLNTSCSHTQMRLPDLDLFSNVSSQMPNALVWYSIEPLFQDMCSSRYYCKGKALSAGARPCIWRKYEPLQCLMQAQTAAWSVQRGQLFTHAKAVQRFSESRAPWA